MRLELAEMLDGVRRSSAEHAWIKVCRAREAARGPPRVGGSEPSAESGQLHHLVITALDRCVFMGWMTGEQFAVLATHGAVGPPNRTDLTARLLWDAGVAVLEAEMNRMVFPPAPARAAQRDDFFWGPRGIPFVDAANAWWWTLDCLDARAENRRENSGLRVGRPCEPDDIVNALLRLNLSPTHARTIMAWGRKRDKPPRDTAARQYWDEVMARLTPVLRDKGIVQPGTKVTRKRVEIVSIPIASAELTWTRTVPEDEAAYQPYVEPGVAASEQGLPRRRSASG
jgi:hypothetical protein